MRVTTFVVLALVMMGCGYGSRNYMNTGGGTGTPAIANLSPASTMAGSGAFTLTVNGSNFGNTSVVFFNGVAESTMFVSANQVAAAIPATAVANSGTLPVYVHSGVYNSNTINFTVQ
jgi:trimeric autotransporter adhesin